MSGWLPPGVTDADIDRAAPGYYDEPTKIYVCDNCQRSGTEDEVWPSWHRTYGDVCQCYECRGLTREEAGLE